MNASSPISLPPAQPTHREFGHLSIKARLFISLGLLGAMLTAIAATGWIALAVSNAGLQTVYDDRVVPLRDLKVISDMYAVNIVDTAHKARNGNLPWDAAVKSVDEARTTITRRWKGYTETYLVEQEKRLVREAHPLMEKADAAVTELLSVLQRKDQAALDAFVKERLYAVIDPVSENIGKLVDLQIDVAQQEYERASVNFGRSRWLMTALVTLGFGVALFAVATTVRRVTRPLAGMTKAMSAVAGGNTNITVPALGQHDEMGALAQALQVFKENKIVADRLAAEQQAEQQRKEQRQRTIEGHIKAFDEKVSSALGTLASASTELRTTAESMSATAEETSRQSTAVAAASEEASTNVQTVAAASEELSSSITEISRQVSQSAKIAGHAVDEANQTNQSVQGLAEAAQKIGDVVKLINDIAGQTNLLALNATIEAARAGEAGKGFAVVASEVKSLANQTARATEDIAAQINAIQAATQHSVQAIGGIGKTISEINEIATTIASAVEEQGAATQEIARNVQQAAAGTNDVSSNIAGVTQAAGETGAAANQVRTAAGELSQQSETLRAEVDSFLASIRAA